jgi:hypothetical protein
MTYLLNQLGNVDDIKNSIKLMPLPTNKHEIFMDILHCKASLNNERENQKRNTVIKLIEQRIKKLKTAYYSH